MFEGVPRGTGHGAASSTATPEISAMESEEGILQVALCCAEEGILETGPCDTPRVPAWHDQTGAETIGGYHHCRICSSLFESSWPESCRRRQSNMFCILSDGLLGISRGTLREPSQPPASAVAGGPKRQSASSSSGRSAVRHSYAVDCSAPLKPVGGRAGWSPADREWLESGHWVRQAEGQCNPL